MIDFFSRRFRTHPDGSHDEAGLAMIICITVVMLMAIIPLAVVQGAIGQLPLARHDQDHESALAAAEAGVDDYLNRLAQNSNYWVYNATNLPPTPNPAFTGWTAVPGGSSNGECFRYHVDSSKTAATGIVYLTSSGMRLGRTGAGCATGTGVIRTVSLGLRRQGFLDYLWLTDYEITDPALSGANATACTFHAWEWNAASNKYGPSDPANCSVVYWTTLSVMNGPVHSNDGLYVCGAPTFNGDTDTYYNSLTSNNVANSKKFGGPGAVLNPLSCANAPNYGRGGDPASGSILPFPPANTAIKSQADGSLGGTGCLYTGPTTITLLSNGTMNVSSSKTKSTNTGCGPGNGLSLPVNGVVYVQNVPSSTSDPNHSSCSGSTCNGDVNISGTLNGQLTVASQDDIDITGNLVYHQYPSGGDVLGLVADNDVAVVHAANADVTDDLTIDAAIMSLNHSFYVQNWSTGGNTACTVAHPCAVPGAHSLIINGVITQKFRGPVGTFNGSTNPPTLSSGYNKSYTYDTRLKYLSPPYFLSPTQSAWVRISYAEVAPNPNP
ncbi:MAG TPA: pilus assembly PilX N-terminal domain-containing protein [Acidimicrobiia bacterium]|nr:pilus assembly PilX N-terminal domain-containing protein [Acidimicrobiia bacterium]